MPELTLPASLFRVARAAVEVGAEDAPLDADILSSMLGKVRDAASLAFAPAEEATEVSVVLDAAELDSFAACFTVGAEDNPDVADEDYAAIQVACESARPVPGPRL